jgi:inhibitor of cysteine peptidase
MKPATSLLAVALLAGLLCMVPACMASEINAGEGDNGRVVSARTSDVIVVSLPENPSTGYLWDMKATPGLMLISNTFVRSPTKYIGGAGTRIWRYQVGGTGTQSLTGSYHRPWLPSTPTDRKFSFSVQVDAKAPSTATGSCPYGICKPGFGGSSSGLKPKSSLFF